jgi:hypothetical protein
LDKVMTKYCIACESPVDGEFDLDDIVTCEECW